MKYKNRLIVPTLISTSIFVSSISVAADEIDNKNDTSNNIIETTYNSKNIDKSQVIYHENENISVNTESQDNISDETMKAQTDSEETDVQMPKNENSFIEEDEVLQQETHDEYTAHNEIEKENSQLELNNDKVEWESNGTNDLVNEDSNDDIGTAAEQNKESKNHQTSKNETLSIEENEIPQQEIQNEYLENNEINNDKIESKSNEITELNKFNESNLNTEENPEGHFNPEIHSKKSNQINKSSDVNNDNFSNESRKSNIDENFDSTVNSEASSKKISEKKPEFHHKVMNTMISTSIEKELSHIPVYSEAQKAAKIRNRDNSGLFAPVHNDESVPADRFYNMALFIDQQAEYNGERYYRVNNGLNGPRQGWMKADELSAYNYTTPTNHKNNYYVNESYRNSYLLSEPWGTSKQRLHRLNKYSSATAFSAEKTMTLGNHTYLYGKMGNDYGWIRDTLLTSNKPSAPSTPVINTVRYNQSLSSVLNTQMNLSAKPQAWVNGGGWRNATRNEVRNFLDTSHHRGGAWDYTFLNLNQNQGISSSVLNQKILSNRGILTNKGNAFTQASKRHGVNEVYLISHAVLETGHGSSQLAQGVRLNSAGNISSSGKKYYNMYGIGAVDHNALLGGARYAQRMGWDTPEKAIIGGAAFVSQNYFNRGQTTLYSMRWNPRNPGTYQYATDVNWAYATANNLKSYYDALGIRGRYFTKHVF